METYSAAFIHYRWCLQAGIPTADPGPNQGVIALSREFRSQNAG